ncbi:MAG: NAD(P)/FAD-dependent oxidoreductase [Desulfitobacteriaceae bacterium]|nr:NAD(P)/FAD-dependent oxidoreductase [Desulfitobacteriaceae bacterium]
MKIAIMGAGLSGLSCAVTLERNGISPVIFEHRRTVGDRFVNGEILLSLLNRPIFDSLAYFSEQYGIYLHPTANIKKLVLHSEKNQAVIHGHLGFTNIRGRHEDSFEKQLARQVKSNIIYNSQYSYEQLLKDFTHVVLATGDAAYAIKIQDYRKDLTVHLRGATVTGNFDPYSAAAWLDNQLAPKGYGYFIPFSEKEANIVIAFPEYQENISLDINKLWENFFYKTCEDHQQNLKITDNFEISGYIIGICKYPRIGNTFFTGNCFGSIMPFLGFGQFAAILTGIYAAYDLCGLGKYEKLTIPLRKSYENSLALRRSMEKLSNHKMDILVKRLNGTLGNKLFNSKHYNPLKLVSRLLKPLTI